MSRSAKLGLFLLMGLVVALARLVELEVSRLRPTRVAAPNVAALLPVGHEPAKPAPRPPVAAPKPRPEPVTPARVAPRSQEETTSEWPDGPFYTVKKGETLGEISAKVLGSSRHWQRLYEANAARVPNPKAIRAGTRLIVPRREER